MMDSDLALMACRAAAAEVGLDPRDFWLDGHGDLRAWGSQPVDEEALRAILIGHHAGGDPSTGACIAHMLQLDFDDCGVTAAEALAGMCRR